MKIFGVSKGTAGKRHPHGDQETNQTNQGKSGLLNRVSRREPLIKKS